MKNVSGDWIWWDFAVSVMRNLKPFGFYPMSLAVFEPMLCGSSNLLAGITCGIKDWPLENTHQAGQAENTLYPLSCYDPQLIRAVFCFPIEDVCWFFIRGFTETRRDYLGFHAPAKATSPVCSVSKPNNFSITQRTYQRTWPSLLNKLFLFFFFWFINQDIRTTTKKKLWNMFWHLSSSIFGLLAD